MANLPAQPQAWKWGCSIVPVLELSYRISATRWAVAIELALLPAWPRERQLWYPPQTSRQAALLRYDLVLQSSRLPVLVQFVRRALQSIRLPCDRDAR